MSTSSSITILTPQQIDSAIREIKGFQNSLQQINNQLPSLLDSFQNAYVTYHMNPENNEYETTFTNINNQIQTLNSKLFSIQNTVQQNMKTLDKFLLQINQGIQQAKKKNTYLHKKYNQIDSNQEGSIERVDEFNELYNHDYWQNVYLFIGLLVSLYLSISMFR
jgi:predicted  nucleic acid-binding Zn-ribbon protein